MSIISSSHTEFQAAERMNPYLIANASEMGTQMPLNAVIAKNHELFPEAFVDTGPRL